MYYKTLLEAFIANCRLDDVLWDVAATEDDFLGLDHLDRTRAVRNGGGDLFLR